MSFLFINVGIIETECNIFDKMYLILFYLPHKSRRIRKVSHFRKTPLAIRTRKIFNHNFLSIAFPFAQIT